MPTHHSISVESWSNRRRIPVQTQVQHRECRQQLAHPNTSSISLIVTIIALLAFAQQTTYSINVPAAYDFWITDIGETSIDTDDFGTVPLKGNPSGVYPGGSWPKPAEIPDPPPASVLEITWTDTHGNQVSEDSIHKVNQTVTVLYDTVVKRPNSANLGGSPEDVAIQMVWLSLMSDPIFDGPDVYQIFVGLHDDDGDPNTVNQLEGKMRLIPDGPDGRSGAVDIGRKGDTTDDVNAPDFLGLPVTYDVIVVKNSLIFAESTGDAVFHGDTQRPSGLFSVVPETTSNWLQLGAVMVVLIGAERGLRHRKEPQFHASLE